MNAYCITSSTVQTRNDVTVRSNFHVLLPNISPVRLELGTRLLEICSSNNTRFQPQWCDIKDEVVVWKKMLPPLFKYRYSRRCVGWTFHRLNKSHVASLVCHISVEQTGALHRRVGLVNTSQQIKSDNPMLHIGVWILIVVDSC